MLLGLLALMGLALASPGFADRRRHSGTVVAVERARPRLTIEEMGPWTGRVESTVSRVTLRLDPDVQVRLAARRETPPDAGAWPGGFVEKATPISSLRPGDYVTVEARSEGGDLVIDSVLVIRPMPESGPRQG